MTVFKRVGALAFAAVFCLALAACGGQPESSNNSTITTQTVQEKTVAERAFAAYSAVNAAYQNSSALQMDMDMNMSVTVDGKTIPVSASIGAKVVQEGDTVTGMDMDLLMDMSELASLYDTGSMFEGMSEDEIADMLDMLGYESMDDYLAETLSDLAVKMKIVMTDDMLYYDMLGMKIKLTMDELLTSGESLVDFDLTNEKILEMIDFTESDFDDATMTEKDGGSVISFTVSGKYMENISGMLGSSLSSLGMGASLSYDDMNIVMTIDASGQLTGMEFSTKATQDAGGTLIEMDVKASVKIIDLGSDYTISAPADADEYESMTDYDDTDYDDSDFNL